MKIFHNEEIYIKTDNFSDSIFKENTMFFDIETTGFSPVKAIVYMIGCARRIKNRIVIDQYFAESVDSINSNLISTPRPVAGPIMVGGLHSLERSH